MLSRKLAFGPEARAKVREGINKLYSAVSCTLGPGGGTVLYGDPYLTNTKDGVTVAKQVILSDQEENFGNLLGKISSLKTNEIAGDGTSSTVVLLKSFCDTMEKHTSTNRYKKIGYLKDFVKLFKEYIESVTERAKPHSELLKSIATISANDREIGEVVAELVSDLGVDGSIFLEPNDNRETIVDKTLGFSFENGWESQHYVNTETGTVEFNDPIVVIADMYIDKQQFLSPAIEVLLKSFNNKPIVIVSQGLGEEAKQFINKNKNVVAVASVKGPEFGDTRTENMEDLAKFLGGVCITPDLLTDISKIKPDYCGRCERVLITSDRSTFVGGVKGPEYDKRCEKLAEEIEKSNGDLKEYLRARLSRLNGVVAKIKIGNGSYNEFTEKRYRFEDAINSARAALRHGVVPGGGITYIAAGQYILEQAISERNIDRSKVLIDLANSLDCIVKIILKNYGYSDEEFSKLKETIIDYVHTPKSQCIYEPFSTYDIDHLGKLHSAEKLGVLDPALVLTTAVESASIAAITYVTTECIMSTDTEQLEKLMRLSAK